MRLMKLGWVSAVTLGSLVALEPFVLAQEKKEDKPAAPAAPRITPATPASRPDMRPQQVEARLRSWTTRLGLTEEQKTKIKPILEEEFNKYYELQQDRAMPIDERRKKLVEIRDQSQAKMKPILTAEQQQKMLNPRPAVRPVPGPAGTPATPAAPAAPAPTPPAPAK